MADVQETIDMFIKYLEDDEVETLLIHPGGAVSLEDKEHQNKTVGEPIPAEHLVRVERALAVRNKGPRDALCKVFVWRNIEWTILSAPLVSGTSIIARRAERQRHNFETLVDRNWLSGEEASAMINATRDRDNILIATPTLSDAHVFMDALMGLDEAAGNTFFIGNTSRLSHEDLNIHTLSRKALGELEESQGNEVKDMLSQGLRVFSDHLSQAEDLDWLMGGDLFSRGRVGALVASGAEEALQRLYSLVDGAEDTPIPGIIDWVIFIDSKRSMQGAQRASIHRVGWAPESQDEDPQYEDAPHDQIPPQGDAPAQIEGDISLMSIDSAEDDQALSDAMSSAFADFKDDLFSLDLDENASSGDPDPEAEEIKVEEPAGESFSGLMGLTFEPGELDVEPEPEPEPEPGAPAPARKRGRREVIETRSSRYNPDAMRKNAARRPARTTARGGSRRPAPSLRGAAPPANTSPFQKGEPSNRSGRWRVQPNVAKATGPALASPKGDGADKPKE